MELTELHLQLWSQLQLILKDKYKKESVMFCFLLQFLKKSMQDFFTDQKKKKTRKNIKKC